MKFTPTLIDCVTIIDIEPHRDSRGMFARAWCQREFAQQGIDWQFVQMNFAFSLQSGTLRGLHFQEGTDWEAKLVRCTRGGAYVVAVDLRRSSPTHCRWVGVELTADNHRMLLVGKGCAQGYQTLVDNTEMLYQMSTFYAPQSARGYRYDDQAFAIEWPLPVSVLSTADERWSPYSH